MKKINKKRTFILSTILLLLLLASMVLNTLYGKQMPMNPVGTVGNTAGNLNNGGYFCEYGDKVYFANTYDNGSLYSMDLSGDNLKKLNSVEVCNILAGGEFVYYFRTGEGGDAGLGSVRSPKSLNRCKLNGTDTTALTTDIIVDAQLVDNYLYLLATGENHPEFYKMKIDKSESVPLAYYNINPASAANGVIYYNGTQSDHYLYRLHTANDSMKVIWEGNVWYPTLDGDYIYFLDVDNNYRLCRYSLSLDTAEVLTEERVDCFNVGHGLIYYQTNNDEPCLMFMNTDGSNAQVLANGIYTSINMTSQYVYFQQFGNTTAFYQSPLGSTNYNVFKEAKDAAVAELQKKEK